MNTRAFTAALLLLTVCGTGRAQLSGYSSVGFGYQRNPLSNYEKLSDQAKQGYLELDYERELSHSSFGLQYIGGLMMFNRFEGRNFYEHSLSGVYKLRFNNEDQDESTADSSATSESDTTATTETEAEEEQEQSLSDSTATYLDLGAKLMARYDKATYDEFDNQAIALSASYRSPLSDHLYERLGNISVLRSYPNVTTLSNFNTLFSAELGVSSETNLVYGLILSGGLKYYTTSTYDTTQFGGFGGPAQNPTGKGKGNGQAPGAGSSGKKILIKPQDNGTVQFDGSLFLRKDWSSKTSVVSSLGYRWIARSAVRYLAQQASATLVGDDIYNDFFSYEGPELRMRLTSELISKVQLILEAGLEHKRFAAPALSLTGEELASHRTDLRTLIEFYVSRYFEVLNGVGVDVFVDAGFVRNQSNDSYNDHSGYSVSAGLGIGF